MVMSEGLRGVISVRGVGKVMIVSEGLWGGEKCEGCGECDDCE